MSDLDKAIVRSCIAILVIVLTGLIVLLVDEYRGRR